MNEVRLPAGFHLECLRREHPRNRFHSGQQAVDRWLVTLDCLNDSAKRFYRHWDFAELPGYPYRLFLARSA